MANDPNTPGSTYMSVLGTTGHVSSTRAEGNSTRVAAVRMTLETTLTPTRKKRTCQEQKMIFNF